MSDFDGLISTAFKQLFTDAIDEILSDTGLTVPCQLIYSGSKFTECPNCWDKNTIIKTKDGYDYIQNIKCGDYVFDGKNYNKVVKKYEQLYDGELYNIKCGGIRQNNWVTKNHTFPVVKQLKFLYSKHQWKYKKDFCLKNIKIEDVEAKNLEIGDALILPFDNNDNEDLKTIYIDGFGDIECDDDLLYLFGIWIAEGCVHYRKKYIREGSFSLCIDEEDIANKIVDILFKKFDLIAKKEFLPRHNSLNVHFFSVKLSNFLLKFGHLAENKHIYDYLWNNLSNKQKLILCNAYIVGDGHIRRNEVCVSTISKKMSYQYRDVLLNNGKNLSINYIDARIDKNNVKHKEWYNICYTNLKKVFSRNIRKYNSGCFSFIDYIDVKKDKIIVYNMEVENSHKYVANGILTNNCTFNPMTGKSSGQYKTGGPIPFSAGICSYCHGIGRTTDEQTETLYFGVIWDSKQFLGKFPVGNPNEFVQTVSKKTSYDEIKRANQIIIDTGITDYTKNKFERVSEPAFVEFGSSSYIITTWKRTA